MPELVVINRFGGTMMRHCIYDFLNFTDDIQSFLDGVFAGVQIDHAMQTYDFDGNLAELIIYLS
jgi:hypothetical protein